MSELVNFEMPMLGEVMEEGTIGEWFVEVGDSIEKGDDIMAVENDKALIEVDSPFDGVVKEILVAAGETAAVGAVLARIELD
jgi:pyruvate/2-oxoglutarate dehydrogenase complex dihydrolipoamide acyltransferase (E2) component